MLRKKLPEFTDEEGYKFSRRYEEGYDLKGDNRYNLWLSRYHPNDSTNGEKSTLNY